MTETKTNVEFLEQFEPDVFWQRHGRKIIWSVVIVVAVGVMAVRMQQQGVEREEEASRRLSAATDPATLQQIIRENQGKPVAAQALLRLADLQFQAGRYGEAVAVYQELLSKFPNYPLGDSAKLGQAAILEAQGNFEAAKNQYGQLAFRQDSYAAVAAKIGAARCSEALGQTKEARQLYEELMPAVAGTPWEIQIAVRLAVLARSPEAAQNGQPSAGATANASDQPVLAPLPAPTR